MANCSPSMEFQIGSDTGCLVWKGGAGSFLIFVRRPTALMSNAVDVLGRRGGAERLTERARDQR